LDNQSGLNIGAGYRNALILAKLHYENFPVISLLVPKDLRKHLAIIYWFARTADDFADEGNQTEDERFRNLSYFEIRLNDLINENCLSDLEAALSNTIKTKNLSKIEEQQKITLKKNEEEKKSLKNAEIAMDQAKSAIENGEFNEARDFYKKAIDIFKEFGWFDQVSVLYNEINNLEKYETEYLKRKTYKFRKEQQTEEYLQKRTEALLQEKKQNEALKFASMQGLPPAIKNVLEKVNMLKEKAEKEEKASKFERAFNRYKYIQELYNSLPSDKIDLTKEISEMNKKIVELEEKIK